MEPDIWQRSSHRMGRKALEREQRTKSTRESFLRFWPASEREMWVPFVGIFRLFFLVLQDKFWGVSVTSPYCYHSLWGGPRGTSHFLCEILEHRVWVNLDSDPQGLLCGCEISGEARFLAVPASGADTRSFCGEGGICCSSPLFWAWLRFPLFAGLSMWFSVLSRTQGVCFSFPGHCEFYFICLSGIANPSCRVWSLLIVEDSCSQLSFELHLYQLWDAFSIISETMFQSAF